MRCPQCNRQLDIPEYAYLNVSTYKQSVKVLTACCEKMILLSGTTKFSAASWNAKPGDIDDWGQEMPEEKHDPKPKSKTTKTKTKTVRSVSRRT